MRKWFRCLGEWADRLSAHWAFILAFNAGLIGIWVAVGLDAANIMISIVTAELVVLAAGASRRSNLAVHAKLDDLLHASRDTDDRLVRSEQLEEADIEQARLS